MTTRSSLLRFVPSKNQFEVLSIHSDGYPEYMFPTLEHYKIPAMVDKLFSLGNMSVLEKTIEECKPYGGEDDRIQFMKSIQEIIREGWDIDHFYIYSETERRWFEIDKSKHKGKE